MMTIRVPKIGATLLTAASALALGAGAAHAAGYAVKEQSATAQGYAFAGASSAAEDISFMFFNPATVGTFDGMQGASSVAVILPSVKASGATARNAFGGAISGGADTNDSIGVVPSMAGSLRLNEKLSFGLSINAPFGLVTEYDKAWAGRYHATRSALTTITVSPTLAFNPVPTVSLAIGLQAQRAEAELGNAVDLGTIALARGLTTNTALAGNVDGQAKLTGSDWGFGFTAGVHAQITPSTKIGAGFRSQVEHNVNGKVEVTADSPTAAALLSGFNGAGVFTNGAAFTSITTPAMANVGIYHQATPKLGLMLEAQWTGWSAFDELRIDFADNTPDSVSTQGWKDTWYVAAGAKYDMTEQLTLRGGVGYDMTPTSDSHRTPRIPDSDRLWLSVGAGYKLYDWLNLNAGYTYIHGLDAKIGLTAAGENASRGSLSADLEGGAHILTLNGVVKF